MLDHTLGVVGSVSIKFSLEFKVAEVLIAFGRGYIVMSSSYNVRILLDDPKIVRHPWQSTFDSPTLDVRPDLFYTSANP